MKIAIISTSPRKESNSLKVAKYVEEIISQESDQVQLFHFEEIDIPMVGRAELDPKNLSKFQSELIKIWGDADLIIFTIPEYNWITSGELINALHQLGHKHFHNLFDNKVFGFIGVSNGRGGRRPCLEINIVLNKLISFLNGYSVISPKIFESHTTQDFLALDGSSKGDEYYEKNIKSFIDYTLKIANKWHK